MKNAIFVIDMVNGFTNSGSLASKNVNRIVPKIANFLSMRDKKEVFFVCDSHSESDLEMRQYPLHCLSNTYESEIVSELKQFQINPIFHKNSTNAFFEIDPTFYMNFDTFEVVGCCTDICVLQFVLNLKVFFNHKGWDKKIIVYSNLCSTFDSENHNANEYHNFALNLMKNAGVCILEYV